MKKILQMVLLLALSVIFAIVGWNYAGADAKADIPPTPTATQSPTPTTSPTQAAQTCTVSTGIEGGAVNLRECKGAACGAVVDVLTEGESLIIVSASEWINATTQGGITGWVNKKYCKGK